MKKDNNYSRSLELVREEVESWHLLNELWYGEVIKQRPHRAVSKWKEFLYLNYEKTKIRQ